MLTLVVNGLAGIVRGIGRVGIYVARHAGGMGMLVWRVAKLSLIHI